MILRTCLIGSVTKPTKNLHLRRIFYLEKNWEQRILPNQDYQGKTDKIKSKIATYRETLSTHWDTGRGKDFCCCLSTEKLGEKASGLMHPLSRSRLKRMLSYSSTKERPYSIISVPFLSLNLNEFDLMPPGRSVNTPKLPSIYNQAQIKEALLC